MKKQGNANLKKGSMKAFVKKLRSVNVKKHKL